jgi:hypothetical protein
MISIELLAQQQALLRLANLSLPTLQHHLPSTIVADIELLLVLLKTQEVAEGCARLTMVLELVMMRHR